MSQTVRIQVELVAEVTVTNAKARQEAINDLMADLPDLLSSAVIRDKYDHDAYAVSVDPFSVDWRAMRAAPHSGAHRDR
jgi:hypothetical protein